MAVNRLHNEDWLFDSNCFVCEPSNETGLRLPFDHDDEADVVTTSFNLGAGFSGAPNFIHGGVTLAILDEAQAWATIAVGGKFAVTTETTTRFRRPVMVGEEYSVEARITEQDDSTIRTAAEVRNADGKVCAKTTASFVVLSAATARNAIGTDVEGSDTEFLK